MRAPEFWQRRGWAALLLWALAGRLRRRWVKPYHVAVPVICIGNLVAGGGGKTPLAIAVARRLIALGHKPHVLSRGYGGRLKGPQRVDLNRHGARDVGDEPLLIARHAPVWIGADRRATARAAIAAGANVLVMDDGFQNPSLAKDLCLVAVDGGYGLGNGRVMPAGPLREPVADGLARADAVVVIGQDLHGLADHLAGPGRPALAAVLQPPADAKVLDGAPVWAFAGIARPEKFFATLEDQGAIVLGRRSFSDHHAFDPLEIMTMVEAAHALGAELITTEKDWVRLDADARMMVDALPVNLVFARPEMLDTLLADALETAS
jgi:tetraacyldisaccharide 4'-kinase